MAPSATPASSSPSPSWPRSAPPGPPGTPATVAAPGSSTWSRPRRGDLPGSASPGFGPGERPVLRQVPPRDSGGPGGSSPRTLRVAGHIDRGGVGGSGPAGFVDDVVDDADSAQGDGQEVVELDPGGVRGLERMVRDHRRIDVEVAVAAEPVGLMAGDAGCYLIGRVAVARPVHPGGLVRRVV